MTVRAIAETAVAALEQSIATLTAERDFLKRMGEKLAQGRPEDAPKASHYATCAASFDAPLEQLNGELAAARSIVNEEVDK